MKFIALFIVSTFILVHAIAQSFKIESLYENQQFQLNSGSRALVGGQSRTYIPISIPQGALQIIYTVKSTVNYDAGQNIKLVAELSANLTGNVLLAKLIDKVNMPPSNAVIDVYVLPNDNINLGNFMAKKDGIWKEYTDYACSGSLGCKRAINVDRNMTKVYLALRNPSAFNKIIAVVDVVAIIPIVQTKNGWTKQQKDFFFTNTKKNIQERTNNKWSTAQIDSLLACFIDKLTAEYSPEELTALPEYEQTQKMISIKNDCELSLGLK